MVGAADIIAHGFGGVAAEEHRSRMADLREDRLGIGERQFEVLGREPVAEGRRLVEAAEKDDRAIALPARPRRRLGRETGEAALDGGGDRVVASEQAVKLARGLEKAGKPYRLLLLGGVDHPFPAARQTFFDQADAFFRTQ